MAETDIELKVGLDNKDAVQRSKELQNEIQRTFNKIDTSKMNASTKASINRLNKLSEKASEIQKKMEALSGDAINTEEYHKLQEELEKANTNFDHALDRQEALEQSGHATTEQITAARAETDRWAETISSIQERMSALESSSGGLKENVPTAEYKELQDELEKLNASFDTALDKQQALEESEWGHPDQIKAAREETDKWADSIEEVRQKMAAMEEAGTAYEAPQGASEEYSKLESQLEDVNNQMDVQLTRQQQMEDGFRRLRINSNTAFGRIFNQFSDGAFQVHQMAQGIQNIGPAIQGAMSGATTGFAAFNSIAGAAIPIIGGITTVAGLLITAISKLVEAIHKAVQAMVEAIAAVEKKLVNSVPILKQVVGMITNPKGTLQTLKQFGTTISGYIKKLIASVASIVKKGISTAIGNIKSSISEGIGALEQWQIAMGNTSNSISALKGSLDLLKMNIGAAFAPILDAAAPALLQLISILNQATITIGSFFAALGGKTKILVAKSATASLTNASTAAGDVANAAEDSTDSLGNSYQALEKVGEGADTAAGKLNNFLGSYDELNVIGQDSGGGGGAGGGADLSANFEEIEIGEDIIEFANKVRDAWAKADFTELGRELGEKFIGILNIANDWMEKNGKPFAVRFGKSLATLINGFTSATFTDEKTGKTKTVGYVLGETIANGIDVVLKGLDSFLSNLDTYKLSHFFIDTMKGLLEKDETWTDLGNVITKGLNATIQIVKEFLDPKNRVFAELGERIAQLVDRLVNGGENGEEGFDFKGFGELIANGISSQLDLVYPLLEKRQTFYNLGSNLGEALNAGVEKFTQDNGWQKLGTTLINAIKDVFLVLGAFLDTWNWQGLSDGIANTINTAIDNLSKDDAKYFVSTLYRLGITLKNLLQRAAEQINADGLGQTIAGAMEGMNIEEGMASFSRLAHTIVGKLLDTLIATVKTLQEDGQFENFGAQVYNGMSSVDWSDIVGKIFELLKRLSDVGLQAMGGFLKEAIKGMLRNVVSTVVDFFLAWMPENVREKIKDQINRDLGLLPTEASAAAVDAGKVIAGDFTHGLIGTTEEELNSWPNSTVSTQLENSKTTNSAEATSTGEEIGNSLASGAINTTEEKLKDWPNSIVSENLETANTTADTKVDEIKGTITGGLEETKTESGNILDKLLGTFTGTFEDINAGVNGQGGSMPKLKQGVSTTTEEIKNDTVQKVQQMSTNTQNAYNEMKENTVGANGSFTAMKDKASTIAAGLKTDVSKEVSDLGSNVQSSTSVDIKQVTIEAFEEMAKRVAGNSETDTTAIVPKVKDVIIKCFEEMQKKLVEPNGYVPEIKKKTEDAFTELKNKLVGPTGQGGLANNIKNYTLSAFRNLRTGMQTEYTFAANDLKDYVNISIYHINQLIAAYNALRAAASMSGGGGSAPVAAVPKLATGAVIPPNQPFLAMLGDQRSGTNIEAPLSTIQEAVANVLEPYLAEIADNTARTAEKDLTVRIGDRDIARSATRGQKMMGLKIRTV